jgi:hypothetical protein
MKVTPIYILRLRSYMMFYYISVALWQHRSNHSYPLISLPDWAVHYMFRYMYIEEGEDSDIVNELTSLAELEWQHRIVDRKIKRTITT